MVSLSPTSRNEFNWISIEVLIVAAMGHLQDLMPERWGTLFLYINALYVFQATVIRVYKKYVNARPQQLIKTVGVHCNVKLIRIVSTQ